VPPPRLRRLTQLYAGLALYGFSDALMLLAGLGVDPWDVLHQGLSRRLGLGVGTWAIIVGALVLALWIPLRQRPGFGTISNVIVVGAVIDVCMATIPAPHGLPLRTTFLLSGVFLNGVATGAYIGAGLGPGPRDGLMTGLAARGHSIRVVRTGIEVIGSTSLVAVFIQLSVNVLRSSGSSTVQSIGILPVSSGRTEAAVSIHTPGGTFWPFVHTTTLPMPVR